jgi:phosphopantetheinyl transferase
LFSRVVDVFVADLSAIEIDESVLSVAELGHSLDIAMSDQLPEYLAAHTWLRNRLAEYLDVAAGDIELGMRENGKPTVTTPATDLEFNLAYANWTGVLAVAFRHDVGVDIRSVNGVQLDPGEIARTLAPIERERFDQALNPTRTFLQFVVRKEALAKATGHGAPEEPRRLDTSGLSPVEVGDHEITDLNLGDQFVAAVASQPGPTIDLTVDTTAEDARLSFAVASV